MRIAMINASPRLMIRKQDTCASYTILQDIRRQLRRSHIHDFEDFHVKTGLLTDKAFSSLMACDVWLISFPIYACGMPSHLLAFLTEVESRVKSADKVSEIQVYAVGNGGLFEGNEAYPAFRMLALWCTACHFSWCGGFGVGGGPLHRSLNVSQIALGQRRSYGRRLSDFTDAIAKSIPTLNTSCSPDVSRQGYILRRNRRYRALAREHGVTAAEISQKG